MEFDHKQGSSVTESDDEQPVSSALIIKLIQELDQASDQSKIVSNLAHR